MRRLVAVALFAVPLVAAPFAAVPFVACNPSPHAAAPAGAPGHASGSAAHATASATAACDAVRPKVAQLYRAELRDRDPARIDQAVADNTTMVLNDCIQTPDRTPACVAAATTIRELEACLIPLDDEGTEGDRLAR
jgi:hypothetical protein